MADRATGPDQQQRAVWKHDRRRAAPRHDGVAYALSPPQVLGGNWTESILHDFNGTTDGQGGAPLLLTGHGTELVGLDSTFFQPGARSVLFDIRLGTEPPAFGVRALSEDGVSRGVPLIDRSSNVLFGSTMTPAYSAGAIEEYSPPSVQEGAWTETVLHGFTVSSGQGYTPNIALLRTAAGTLFGTTQRAGSGGGTADGSSGGLGAVFRLDPPVPGRTDWTYSELHQFDGDTGSDGSRPDGNTPNSALVFGRHHQLYGTTEFGGRHCFSCGTIFMQTWH